MLQPRKQLSMRTIILSYWYQHRADNVLSTVHCELYQHDYISIPPMEQLY